VSAFSLNLEDLGEVLKKTVDAFSDVTEAQAVEIGQGISASLLGAAPLVEEMEVQRYVNRVGAWLAPHTERPDLPWTFAVIETDSYNIWRKDF
jgi:predicted Zn-dependent protease